MQEVTYGDQILNSNARLALIWIYPKSIFLVIYALEIY